MGGRITTWALDLDGVVRLGDQIIPGAQDAIGKLKANNVEVGFVTNMSFLTLAEQEEKLESAGIPAKGRVITSAMSAVELLTGDERVLICGGPGIYEAVKSVGAEVVESETDSPDVVIVGMNPKFTNRDLTKAMRAVRAGARLIGANSDPIYPTLEGIQPGGGAQLAAIATAAETTPIVTGKPNEAMVQCVRRILGEVDFMVGDRADSDGRLASVLDADFALVFSGATKPEDMPVDPSPQITADNLASLVDEIFGS